MIKKAERELDLREMLIFLWQHIAIVLLCAVLGAILTIAGTAYRNNRVPIYSATALLTFDVSRDDASNRFEFYSNITNMSSVIVKSDELLETVIADLELSLEPADLKENINLESINSSSFMRLTVTNTDEEQAQQICTQILAVAPEISEKMTGIGALKAVSGVEVSATQTAGVSAKSGAVGALLGVILSILVLIGMELFDHTLQDAGDVEYYLELKNLEVIPEGGSLEKKAESYRLLCTHLQNLAPKDFGWSLLIAPAGKKADGSVVAEELSASLAEAGRKVLLVDAVLDEGKLSERMKMKDLPGLSELLQHGVSINEAIHIPQNSNFEVLPCGREVKNLPELLREENVRPLFTELRKQYDCILLVAPDVVAAHDAVQLGSVVDGVLLVAAARKTEIETAMLAKEKLALGKAPVWGVVLTGYEWKKAKRRDGYYYVYSSGRRL